MFAFSIHASCELKMQSLSVFDILLQTEVEQIQEIVHINVHYTTNIKLTSRSNNVVVVANAAAGFV